jgi:hypothetical protein
LSAIPLFLLLALRYQVGTDYNTYSNAYISISRYSFFEAVPDGYVNWLGNGFVFLCKTIALFAGSNYFWYHAILAALAINCLYIAIFKNSVLPLLSLFIYLSDGYYYQLFNQSRQGLAILIVFISYKYIFDKKVLPFIITVLIAALVHPSALIFLPAYFLAKVKLNVINFICIVMAAIFLIYSWEYLKNIVLLTRYSGYIDSGYDVEGMFTTVLRTIYRSGIMLFCLFFRKTTVKAYPKANNLYAICICAVILQIAAIKSYIFARTVIYYYIGMLLLVPYIIKAINKKSDRIIVASILVTVFITAHIIYFIMKADLLLAPFYQTFIGQGIVN